MLAFILHSHGSTYFCDMAVSAVEQLQVMASKRQYKEASAQLEVTYLLVYSVILF